MTLVVERRLDRSTPYRAATPVLDLSYALRESPAPSDGVCHLELMETAMARFLISFDDGTMDLTPEEMADAGVAAHAVVRAAQDAGVWIFGGGLESQRATIVTTDGNTVDGPYPENKAVLGGFSIIDVASLEEALSWAAKFAVACRCAQEVRAIMFDPLV